MVFGQYQTAPGSNTSTSSRNWQAAITVSVLACVMGSVYQLRNWQVAAANGATVMAASTGTVMLVRGLMFSNNSLTSRLCSESVVCICLAGSWPYQWSPS